MNPLHLTDEELAWLEAHPEVDFFLDDGAEPYQYRSESGIAVGITPDLLKAMASRLGIRFHLKLSSQAAQYQGLKAGHFSVAGIWPLQGTPLDFPYEKTRSIVKGHITLFGREADFPEMDPELLKGKTIAMFHGIDRDIQARLAIHNELLLEDDLSKAVGAVLSKQADLFMAYREVGKFNLKKNQVRDIRELYTFPSADDGVILVHRDEPLLLSILDKALADIEHQELPRILSKWYGREVVQPSGDKRAVHLTPEEKRWLSEHQDIVVAFDGDYAPYSWVNAGGEFVGIAVDVTREIARRAGLRYKVYPSGVWKDLYGAAELREVDVIATLTPTPDRLQRFHCSRPYLSLALYVITRKDNQEIKSREDISGKTVALVKGYNSTRLVLEAYPAVIPYYVDNITAAIVAVSEGKAEATVAGMGMVQHIIALKGIGNLRFAALYAQGQSTQAFGVRKDWPELATILDKTLASLSEQDRLQIFQTWSKPEVARVEVVLPHVESIPLTPEERSWLGQHPVIRVSSEADYAPFDFQVDGEPTGYSIDYVKLIAGRLGVRLEFVRDSWANLLEKAKHREVDLLHSLFDSPSERKAYLNFTRDYKQTVNAIITRMEISGIHSVEDLAGRNVSVVAGDSTAEIVRRQYPAIRMIRTDSYEASIKAVALGQVDATIIELPIASYLIRHYALTNLKVAASVGSLGGREERYRLAVRKDWPELIPLLEKAMDSITADEMATLDNRWMTLPQSPDFSDALTPVTSAAPMSTTAFLVQAFIVILVFSALAYLFLRLIAMVRGDPLAYDFGSPQVQRRLIGFNALIVALIVVTAWASLESIKRRSQGDMHRVLQAVMNGTRDGLASWVDEHGRKIARLALHPTLVNIAGQQLDNHQKTALLFGSSALVQLRGFFEEHRDLIGHLGYFVIAPDGTTLGSMRDTNLGTENLIWKHRPDLFERVLNGEILLVPPIPSDVPLPGAKPIGSTEKPSTMFFMAPIRGDTGEVIAVLAQRFNPHGTFSRIPRLGRVGKGGETYFFDRQGLLLSESRYPAQLIRSGLMPEKSQSILTVGLRNPGRNLLETGAAPVPQDELPMTVMAQSATAGGDGFNVDGYRNYLGVTVIGVWSWIDAHGLGIATEIDANQAYGAFRQTRLTIVLLLSITIFLSLSYTSVSLYMGKRAAVALKGINEQLEDTVRARTDALRKSEAHFRSLVTNIPGAVYRCALDEHWTMYYMSDRIQDICGYPASDFFENRSRTFASLIVQEDQEAVESIVRGGVTRCEPYAIEYRILHSDGSVRWVHEEGRAMRDESDAVTHLDGFIMDISERKEKDKFLRFATYALENTADAAYWVESETGRLYFVNRAACEHLRYGREELLALTVHDIDALLPKERWSQFKMALTEKGTMSFETQHRSRDGSLHPVEITVSTVDFEGGGYFVAFARDISGRKKAEAEIVAAKEAAEAASKAKSLFLANMSHEIRTPMNAILGYSQLMQRDRDLSQDHKKSLKIINRSGEYLLDLINDVLEMSKIEAGRIEVVLQSFDLHGLLDDLERMFRVPAEAKGLSLSFSYSGDLPRYVRSDEGKVRQVLINLLGNAVKFTKAGFISLSALSESNRENRAFHLSFAVQDCGFGIAPGDHEKIFGAFDQTDTGRGNEGGTGLGLAISRQYARLLGGDIGVESELGEGSTFSFYIQAEEGRAEECRQPVDSRRVVGLSSGQGTYRILVADDLEHNRDILTRMLSRVGFEVREVANGRECVDAFEAWSPHAIMMDIRMPVMNGVEATQEIRKLPGGSDVAIFAVSASALDDQRLLVLQDGMANAFIPKPFREHEVFDELHCHMGIEFAYEEAESTMDKVSPPEKGLTRSMLDALPASLREELFEASLNVDLPTIKRLLGVMEEDVPDLASGLRQLADQYAYDRLQALLGPDTEKE